MTQKEYYDYREDENTRQISLAKLLRCALMRWKVILLAGIILGGIMGSYKILSIHSKKDAMIKEYDSYKTKLEVYKTSVSEYKKTIASLQEDVEAKLDYINNSPKMRLSYYDCPTSFAEIAVTGSDGTALTAAEISSIMNAVFDEIYYGDALSKVAEKYDLDAGNLRQITSCRLVTTGSVVRIICRGDDTAQAEAIRDELLNILIKEKTGSFKSLGNFNLSVVNKGTASIFDTELQTYQTAQNDALSKLQTALYTAQNQSNGLTKPVAVDQYSKKYMLINGIKLGIVGMAAGILLALVTVVVMIIRKGVILSPDEIDGEFGLKTLADLSGKKASDPAELEFMMARIENCMEGKGDLKIGVVGSVPSATIDSLAAKLNEMAGDAKDTLKFVSIPGFSKEANAFRKLKDMSAVVLTEEIGRSDYLGIRKEIALIAESGKELIGTVYY